MTVALAVKVYDGIVLATDSATTLVLPNGSAQVYNHANKTFNLDRRYPIGAMTWGLGQLGSASISSIAKDLRRAFMGKDKKHEEMELPEEYKLAGVVEATADWFGPMYADQVELFDKAVADGPPQEDGDGPRRLDELGIAVAGYSGVENDEPELYEIAFRPDSDPEIVQHLNEAASWVAFAQTRAAERLFKGVDPRLAPLLLASEGGTDVLDQLRDYPVQAAMPIQDAVDFARFLADVTVGYSRYILGPDTVGGAVDLAAITRHEGFKWVERKHYFESTMNPKDETRSV